MATPNTNASDAFYNQFMSSLMKPATVTQRSNSAGTAELQQLLKQLQDQATPEGSAALIKKLYDMGMAEYMPQINRNVAQAGARSGTSSYQALATSNLQAKLAGAADVAVQEKLRDAANVAAKLSDSTAGTRVTQEIDPLKALGIPLLGQYGKKKLESLFAEQAITSQTAAVSAFDGGAFAMSDEWALAEASAEGATGAGVGSFSDIFGPGIGGFNPIVAVGMYIASQPDGLIDTTVESTVDFVNEAPQFVGSIPQAVGDIAASAPGDIAKSIGETPGDAASLAASGIKDILSPITDPLGDAWDSGKKVVGTVICTELNKQKLLPDVLYAAYAKKLSTMHPLVVKGYQAWAVSYVRQMRKPTFTGKALTKLALPLAVARARYITGHWNILGFLTVYAGEPICWLIGKFVTKQVDYMSLYKAN